MQLKTIAMLLLLLFDGGDVHKEHTKRIKKAKHHHTVHHKHNLKRALDKSK